MGQLRHHPEPGGGPEEAGVRGAGAELLGAEEAVEEQRAVDPPAAGQPSAAQSQADGQCCRHSGVAAFNVVLPTTKVLCVFSAGPRGDEPGAEGAAEGVAPPPPRPGESSPAAGAHQEEREAEEGGGGSSFTTSLFLKRTLAVCRRAGH